jgi:putative flavoprotein involved in K+ transport
VWLSVRRPPNLLPREIDGLPLHPLAVALRGLPMWLRDQNARLLQRLFLGDLSAFGLPLTPHRPYRTLATTGVTVAVDTGFSRYVRSGRIKVVSQIDHFAPDEVILTDGAHLQPDVVLLATGYRPCLQHFVGHLGVLRPTGAHGSPRIVEAPRSGRGSSASHLRSRAHCGFMRSRRVGSRND